MKVLLDAVYINNSGGKVLLEYLIQNLEKFDLDIIYLLDYRLKNNVILTKNKPIYLKPSIGGRFFFYLKNHRRFKTVLCFGNIPPPFKLNSKVFVFFHQALFLRKKFDFFNLHEFKIFLKKNYIFFVKRNCDFWVVQSSHMIKSFIETFKISSEKIILSSFYPPIFQGKFDNIKPNPNHFIYVSSGSSYKNHLNLIKAFKLFNVVNNCAVLHLTVDINNKDLIKYINLMIEEGVRIINHGNLPRQELFTLYKSCAYVVYPSFFESFGLGILEGLDCNCDIIGADLPYLHSVCIPSITFDPYSFESIFDALVKASKGSLPPSQSLVRNDLQSLVELLIN
jgi:glycosyltransferase involved in cell wall biosynthesis